MTNFSQRLIDYRPTDPTRRVMWGARGGSIDDALARLHPVRADGILQHVVQRWIPYGITIDPASVSINWEAWDSRCPPGLESTYMITVNDKIDSWVHGDWPGDPLAPRGADDPHGPRF